MSFNFNINANLLKFKPKNATFLKIKTPPFLFDFGRLRSRVLTRFVRVVRGFGSDRVRSRVEDRFPGFRVCLQVGPAPGAGRAKIRVAPPWGRGAGLSGRALSPPLPSRERFSPVRPGRAVYLSRTLASTTLAKTTGVVRAFCSWRSFAKPSHRP